MLYYVASGDFPGKKAHTIQQMRMCQAFQAVGEDVCMLHSSHGSLGKRLKWGDIAEYYGLDTQFKIRTIPSLQGWFNSIPQFDLISMAVPMSSWLAVKTLTGVIDETDTVYGRNYYPLYIYNEFRKTLSEHRQPNLVYEQHDRISAHWQSRFFQSIDGFVSITHAFKRAVQQSYGIPQERCFVAPDGTDLSPYEELTKDDVREQLSIPSDEQIVMYTGHLYPSKGVDELVEAASDIDGTVYVVGGFNKDVERVKQVDTDAENLVLTGFVDPSEIPRYQVAADLLVAPYTTAARDYLSPLKLFEYMAAGRPIIASDLPILKEVLTDGHNARLVPPDQPDSLAAAINDLLDNRAAANALAQQGRADVTQYTWQKRAQDIRLFIRNLA